MDTRKLIAFGKATFSVTLPKPWVQKNHLVAGDTLYIKEIANDRLEILPSSVRSEAETSETTIVIGNKPTNNLVRDIIASYVRGHTLIAIQGQNVGKLKAIRTAFHGLVGVEIMDVTPTRVTANVFADHSLIDLPHIIRRIEMITYTLFDDTVRLLTQNVELEEIFEKDYEIDRHALFGIRQIILALETPSYARKLNLKPIELAGTWHVLTSLEVIADYARNLSHVFYSTDLVKELNSQAIKGLQSTITEIRDIYAKTMKLYHTKDNKDASLLFDKIEAFHKEVGKIPQRPVHSHYLLVMEYHKRILSRCRDILRVVGNLCPDKC